MYTYQNFCDDAKYLEFKGVKVKKIGDSVLKNPILAFETGVPDLIVTGGIHARENISVYAAMMMLFKALRCGINNIAVVPSVNPDGMIIVERGANFGGYERLKTLCGGDFSQWKANANAVDLNVNFDAKFGCGAKNVFTPSQSDYVGPAPFSEPETRSLRDYTLSLSPSLTLSLHAAGREVYWYFGQSGERRERDRAIAEEISKTCGYTRVDSDLGSAGGYKDWCVQKLGIAALTMELGLGSHPLPDASYGVEWKKIENVVQTASRIAAELKRDKFVF